MPLPMEFHFHKHSLSSYEIPGTVIRDKIEMREKPSLLPVVGTQLCKM